MKQMLEMLIKAEICVIRRTTWSENYSSLLLIILLSTDNVIFFSSVFLNRWSVDRSRSA